MRSLLHTTPTLASRRNAGHLNGLRRYSMETSCASAFLAPDRMAASSTVFARTGHQVIFSYSRSRQKLEQLAAEAGANASVGTPAEAANGADVVLIAVHWTRVDGRA